MMTETLVQVRLEMRIVQQLDVLCAIKQCSRRAMIQEMIEEEMAKRGVADLIKAIS